MAKLAKRDRERIIELLESGEDLPLDYKHILFPPEKKEYELVYAGKEREEDILAETMAVPLQPIKTFGKNCDGWTNKLIFGDNLQVMKSLLDDPEVKGQVKLIYIDPPFATKQEFKGSQDQKAYQDKIVGAQFIEFLRKRLIFLREVLSKDGSIYVHLDWKKVHYIKLIMDEIFSNFGFTELIRRTVAAHNDPGTIGNIHDTILSYKRKESFFEPPREKTDLKNKLDYDKVDPDIKLIELIESGNENYNCFINNIRIPISSDIFIFNDKYNKPYFRIPKVIMREIPLSDESVTVMIKEEVREIYKKILPLYSNGGNTTAKTLKGGGYEYEWNSIERIWKYKKERMKEMNGNNELWYTSEGIPRKKTYYKGKLIQSILQENKYWNLQGNAKENTGYPTQKPEQLLELITQTSSKKNDIILDCFAGSGTTLSVTEKIGRRWIGIDCGKLSIYTMQKRLLNLKSEIGNKGKTLKPKPFTLYHAGLYDFSKLKQLPWKDWRLFALHLFNCRDSKHTVSGIELDGYRGRSDVLVFNYQQDGGVVLDYGFIDDLHAMLGSKVGKQFFIIAPAASVIFLEDYIEKGSVRYYILRIPYSIINELHNRDFEAIKQPIDESQVNDTVDAVGFDFIRTPKVKCKYSIEKPKKQLLENATIKISTFKSEAMLKGASQLANRESLSMIMVDFNYDGDIFNLDKVYYASEIEKNNWKVYLPVEEIKKQIMIIYLDIYGNEYREIKTIEDFSDSKQVQAGGN